jgi:hypothetical protein
LEFILINKKECGIGFIRICSIKAVSGAKVFDKTMLIEAKFEIFFINFVGVKKLTFILAQIL